jgi:ABC-type uncharacterized transport system involved in gliding motility auxiliary subunit
MTGPCNKTQAWIKAGGGIAGLALLAVIIVAANTLIGQARLRKDLTEERLYTLSEGTLNLLKKMGGEVTLKLYFSGSSPAMPAHIKTYARQVQDLLFEYRNRSGGKVLVEVYDPTPDSDAEDWARRYGLAAQTVDAFGTPVFFGLVAVSGDVQGSIPAFDPVQEELLEYNVTRLIYRVGNPERPVLGVLSSLPVMGSSMPPFGMPPGRRPEQQPAWVAIQNLKQDFELRELAPPLDAIAAEIDALLVIHPKELPDRTLYAIDQFVLRGGHLLLMVDPLSIADDAGQGASPFGMPSRGSDAARLFSAWGVGYDMGRVVADTDAATNLRAPDNRIERSLVALTLATNQISRADILTSKLDIMLLPYAGALTDQTGEKLTFTPLLSSSDHAGTVSAMSAQFGSSAVQREFKDSPVRLTLAARLHGTFATAFPDGQPAAEADADAPEAGKDDAAKPESLKTGDSTVIVVADVDMFFDPVCVEEINIFGQLAHRPRNDNLNFLFNAVEQLSGSSDLVAIRSRGRFARPFDRVLALQAEAMRVWRGREAELEEKLRETERQIQEMQAGKDAQQQFILSPEQQQAIERFRAEEIRVKQELKDVRRQLRRDIERLGAAVKAVNIALVPLLVVCAGIAYWVVRRRPAR